MDLLSVASNTQYIKKVQKSIIVVMNYQQNEKNLTLRVVRLVQNFQNMDSRYKSKSYLLGLGFHHTVEPFGLSGQLMYFPDKGPIQCTFNNYAHMYTYLINHVTRCKKLLHLKIIQMSSGLTRRRTSRLIGGRHVLIRLYRSR